MKKRNVLSALILMLSLTACDNFSFSIGKKEEDKPIQDTTDTTGNNDDKLVHSHTFSTKWESDADNHWHPATCEHTDEVSFLAPHIFGDWIIDERPTTVLAGSRHRVCNTCNYSDVDIINPLERDGLSADKAFTVEDFLEQCKALKVNEPSLIQYYVTGKIKNCTYNTSWGSFSFYFDGYESMDDGTSAFVYSCKIDSSLTDSTTYTAENLEGKEVTVFGYLKNYYKVGENYKYEIAYLGANESPTGYATSPVILEIKDDSTPVHKHTYSDEWSKDETYHWHAATCGHDSLTKDKEQHTFGRWITTKQPTATEEGSKFRSCSYCQYDEYESIPKITKGTGSFTVYSFNDFHGAVNEYPTDGHVGLAKFATYLKQASDKENTIIIDSGDTFQGSIESNNNNGAMITDVFNYAHVDVHTLGNHDFDWGEDKIENNKARVGDDGWKMTNLASNIYDYDFSSHSEGNTQQDRLGDRYYIKTLENGIKIGVVGVIGADQITSICSPLVEDICFKNEIDNVKTISDELKTEKGCDFVIASVHGSAADTMGYGLTDVSPISNRKYVDYVVCGHSHQYEYYTENGVYYTQASAYGERIFTANFTLLDGELQLSDVGNLNYNGITGQVKTVDPNITSIINSYAKDYSSIGSEVLGTLSGNFYKNNQLPNLLSKAVYQEANAQGYNIDMAITNVARYDIKSTTKVTYAQLYEAFPFDNLIYIVKIKGSKNVQQICYSGNYCYHNPSLTSVSTSGTYTIAVIDYLLFHTNSSRYYDYYNHNSGNVQIIGTLKNSKNADYLYRDIAADYIRKQTGTIYASDYANSIDGFVKPTY